MLPLALTLLGGFQARLATALLGDDTADEQARKSRRQATYVLRKALPSMQPPSLLNLARDDRPESCGGVPSASSARLGRLATRRTSGQPKAADLGMRPPVAHCHRGLVAAGMCRHLAMGC